MKTILKISIVGILCMNIYSMTAQTTYKIEGNELVKVESATDKLKPVKTDLNVTIKGIKYPVYKSVRGNFFIIRTSKKTGKTYNQYLKIN